jgi:hypothetical protein
MKAHVLKGSKQEIVEHLGRISGEVREAIVFEEELFATQEAKVNEAADIFAEMSAYMVDVENLDDSREAIYTRSEGE